MRGWPHVVSERLIFNDSSVFLRKCAVLAAAPSKQGVGEAASSVPFPVQEKRGGDMPESVRHGCFSCWGRGRMTAACDGFVSLLSLPGKAFLPMVPAHEN